MSRSIWNYQKALTFYEGNKRSAMRKIKGEKIYAGWKGKKRQGWIPLFSHYIPLRFVRKFNFVLCTRRYHCWCYGYIQLLCTIPKLVKACTWFCIAAQWKIYITNSMFFFQSGEKALGLIYLHEQKSHIKSTYSCFDAQ